MARLETLHYGVRALRFGRRAEIATRKAIRGAGPCPQSAWTPVTPPAYPEGMQPTIRLNHNLLAVQGEHSVDVLVELAAPEAPGDVTRPPLHLALVLDRSGSMAGAKLVTTKACASYLVRRLGPTDQLAVIAYDDQVDLVAPLSTDHGDALLGAIDAIREGGSTNLSGGWLKGLEVLRGRRVEAGPDQAHGQDGSQSGPDAAPPATRRVLLLTDGRANAGITDPDALVRMAGAARAEGVSTTTIGFGDDFAEAVLTGMGDAGGGNAHFVPTPDAAPAVFAQEFDGLASVVAQNVSLEIRPGDDVVLVEVLNRYPATIVAGGVQLALGDAYGGERRAVVFSLNLPALADLGVAKVADVVLRYVSVDDQIAIHELTLPVMVNVVTEAEAAQADADHTVIDEVLILKTAQARDQARRLADAGDFEGGRSMLRECAIGLRSNAPMSSRADELLAEADLLDELGTSLSPPLYDATTQKSLHYGSHETRRRRGR